MCLSKLWMLCWRLGHLHSYADKLVGIWGSAPALLLGGTRNFDLIQVQIAGPKSHKSSRAYLASADHKCQP